MWIFIMCRHLSITYDIPNTSFSSMDGTIVSGGLGQRKNKSSFATHPCTRTVLSNRGQAWCLTHWHHSKLSSWRIRIRVPSLAVALWAIKAMIKLMHTAASFSKIDYKCDLLSSVLRLNPKLIIFVGRPRWWLWTFWGVTIIYFCRRKMHHYLLAFNRNN